MPNLNTKSPKNPVWFSYSLVAATALFAEACHGEFSFIFLLNSATKSEVIVVLVYDRYHVIEWLGWAIKLLKFKIPNFGYSNCKAKGKESR